MKSIQFTATTGDDAGKIYIIEKMSVYKAEKWAAKALLAMLHGGVDIPQDTANAGIAGLMKMGLTGLLGAKWEDVEPLMDEMMEEVQFLPDASNPNVKRKLFPGDIEDVRTLIQLRKAIWNLNTDFLKAADILNTGATAANATA